MIYLLNNCWANLKTQFKIGKVYLRSMDKVGRNILFFDFIVSFLFVLGFTLIVDNPNGILYTTLIGMLMYVNIGLLMIYAFLNYKAQNISGFSMNQLIEKQANPAKRQPEVDLANTNKMIQKQGALLFGIYKTAFAIGALMFIYLFIDNALVVTLFVNYQAYLMFRHLVTIIKTVNED